MGMPQGREGPRSALCLRSSQYCGLLKREGADDGL